VQTESAVLLPRLSTIITLRFPPSRFGGLPSDEVAFAGGQRIRARFTAFQAAEPSECSCVRILARLQSSHAN